MLLGRWRKTTREQSLTHYVRIVYSSFNINVHVYSLNWRAHGLSGTEAASLFSDVRKYAVSVRLASVHVAVNPVEIYINDA